MKKTKKLLAFVLASAMMVSNVAYAAPASGEPSESDATVDTFSFENPKTDTGESSPEDASGSGDAAAADQQPEQDTGNVTGSAAADTPSSGTVQEQPTPTDQPAASGSADAAAAGSSQTEPDSTAGVPSDTAGDETAGGEETEDEEGTGTSQEQTEAALYDVTFTTPEKHGKILRMDDTEVTDGTALKTDENGKAQFKVKADDGYQVDKVINKTTGEELKLIEDSYYELQVEVNTTVEVHYNKVPADENSDDSDDADDADAAETADGAVAEDEAEDALDGAETNENPMPNMSLTRMLEEYANETINVKIEGVDEQTAYDLPVGTIADNAPAYPNYTYEYATLGEEGQKIVALGVYVIGDTTYRYYSTDGSSAQLIGDKEIVLHYSKTPLNVTYKVGPEVNRGTVNGPSQAKAGENVEFTISPALGYEVDTVFVGEEKLEPSATGVYSFTMPEAETVVNISLKKAESYTVTLKPLGNSADYDQHTYWGHVFEETQLGYTVDNGGNATFTIYTDDDTVLEVINKPFDYITINGQRVELNNGECSNVAVGDMTVSAVRHNDCSHGVLNYYYYYTVTITNVEQNLEIGYLIRGENGIADRNVTITEMSDGIRAYVKAPDMDFTEASLSDSFVFEDYGQQIYFYVAVEPGYEGLDLGGEHHQGQYISIDEAISSGYTQAEYAKSLGCQYAFVFTRYSGDNKDRTVTLKTNPLKYGVKYDADGGAGSPIDKGEYSVQTGSNVITVSNTEPTKANSVFVGWKLGDNIYTSGDQITVDSNLLPLAGENRTFTFVAQWKDAASVADYKVEYYKETAIGEYPSSPEITNEFKNATVGEVAIANATPAGLDISGYALDINYGESKLTGVVKEDDSLVLKVFYAKDTNNNGTPDNDELVTLSFESSKGFENGISSPYNLKNQVPNLSFQAPTPVDTDTDKVVFVGWDKGLDKSGKGTVPGEDTTYTAQYKADENNDGVADEEQYVDVTFAIAEEDAAKGTLKGETSYTDLVPGLGLTVPTVMDTEGDDWAFAGWKPDLTTDDSKNAIVPNKTTRYVATWKEDTNHDNKPDEDQYVTLTFESAYGFTEGDSPQTMENQVPNLAFQAPTPVDTDTDKVVFVGWDKGLDKSGKGTVPGEDTTYTAQYKADENNDGVADEEQYVDVTFAIAEEDAAKGTLKGETSYTDLVPGLGLTVPTVMDTEGDDWAFAGWKPDLTTDDSKNAIVPNKTTRYVATWKEDTNHNNNPDEDESYTLVITYAYAEGEEGEAVLPETHTETDLAVGAPYKVESPAVEGYVAEPAVVEGAIVDQDVNVEVVYHRDTNGNGKPDVNESYDLTITYAYAEGEEGEALLPETHTETDLAVGAPYKVESPAVEGYVAEPEVVEGTIVDQDVNVEVVYHLDSNGNGEPDAEESYDLTITYAYAEGEEGEAELPGTYTKTDLAVGTAYSVESPAIEGYVSSPEVVEGTIVDRDVNVEVVYHRDSNGNGEPDVEESYDLTITYAYAEGEGGQATLPETHIETGLAVGEAYSVESPAVEGYVAEPEVVEGTIVDQDVNVEVVYHRDTNGNGEPDVDESYDLTITYAYAEGEEGEAVLPETHIETGLAVGEAYSVESPAVEGYVAEPEVVEGTIVDQDVNVEVAYHRDSNGNGEPDVDESYDLTITYAYAEGEEGEAALPGTYTKTDLAVGTAYSVESPAIEGYVSSPEVVEGTIVDRDVNVEVVYHRDSNGNGEPDVEESYDLTITYAYAEGEEGQATLPETHTETDLAVGEAYSVPSPAVEGHVAEPEVVEGTIVDQDVNVEVVYHRDSNGNGEPDVDESYDLTITYAYAEGEEGEAALPGTYTKKDLAVGEAYNVPSPAVEGYVAEPEVVEGTIVDQDVNVEVVYHRDTNGNGEPDVDESYDLTIIYAYAEGEEGEAPLPETHTETDLAVGEAYSVPSPAVEGYVAEPEVVEGTIVDQDVNVEVAYHRDSNGNGEPDVEESYDLTITYAYAEGEEGEAVLPETHTEIGLAVGAPYKVESPAVEGYVAEPEVVEGTIVDQDVNVEVVYHLDSNGNGEPDVEESYDLTITYAYAEGEEGEATLPETHTETDLAVGEAYSVESPAVEGYVAVPLTVEGTIVDRNVSAEVLYYIDENGNGVPDSEEPDEPTPTPDPDPGTDNPPSITDPDPDDPDTPTTPTAPTTPNPGPTPSGTGPAATTPETRTAQNPDDTDNADDAEAAERYSLTEINSEDGTGRTTRIDEDDTPLGNKDDLSDADAENHDAMCIIHWIVLLAALLAAILFIIDGSRRKNRIKDLRQELENVKNGKNRR